MLVQDEIRPLLERCGLCLVRSVDIEIILQSRILATVDLEEIE